MIKAAIIGYGNIGKSVLEAILASPDFKLVGVVRRNVGETPLELTGYEIVDHVDKLSEKPDVALLCTPTRAVPDFAKEYLAKGINTVDSFDIHTKIWDLKCDLEPVCKENNTVAVISAGWDPGSDSVVRALMEACAPKGITYTNFGPGMSMGHTVAVKAVEGVEGALSMTIPLGTGVHRRMVYVQLKQGANMEDVSAKIKADPYFASDETHVIQVDDIDSYIDKGHGVNMVRKGVSGSTHNQMFEFNMKINNPALTAQVIIACARASFKQQPGAYTMIEIPVIDLLHGDKEKLIKKLV